MKLSYVEAKRQRPVSRLPVRSPATFRCEEVHDDDRVMKAK